MKGPRYTAMMSVWLIACVPAYAGDTPAAGRLQAIVDGETQYGTAFDGNIVRPPLANEPSELHASTGGSPAADQAATLHTRSVLRNSAPVPVPLPAEEQPASPEGKKDNDKDGGKGGLWTALGTVLLTGLMAAGRLVHNLRKSNPEDEQTVTCVIGVRN